MRILITGGSGFIGTNAVEHCLSQQFDVRNFDIRTPRNPEHQSYWQQVDIRDRDALAQAVADFSPTHVLHLAAVTGMEEGDLSAYAANTDGVANLIHALSALDALERVVFTSSYLVCRVGYVPKTDTDYCPPNVYGESKVVGENLVRTSRVILCPWVIVRPTSIWGPWFDQPYRNFFLLITRGFYMHPGRRPVYKVHSFVGNTVHMMMVMLTASADSVAARTFFCLDYPRTSVHEWAQHIQKAVGAPMIRVAPVPILRLLAAVGSGAKRMGWKDPPLTNLRLKNMLTEMPLDTGALETLVGPLPYDLQEGVEMAVKWLYDAGLIHRPE